MPNSASGFSVTKPVSVWNKPLKADFKDMFKALSKTAAHALMGKWEAVPCDLADAAASLGLATDPAGLAWVLIRASLQNAVSDLIEENRHLLGKPPADTDEFCDGLDFTLEQEKLTLDSHFFERPADLPILTALKSPLHEWFRGFGLNEAQAQSIAERLPSYFVFALNAEWRRNHIVYEPVRQVVDTPFTKAAERELAWMEYTAYLQKQFDAPVLGEAFGLSRVYVPLRAYYLEKVKDEAKCEPDRPDRTPRSGGIRVAVDLCTELDKWVGASNKSEAVKVISGKPGSGKSCFTRFYAAHVAEQGKVRVIHIPLHLLNPTGDLITEVGNYVTRAELLPHNPMDPDRGEQRLLVIFDGLDELASQGKASAQVACDFVREVDKTAITRNEGGLRLQVLISGRELAVQESTPDLRKSRQVLHVLPYFVPEDECGSFKGETDLLKIDQRHEWWHRYGTATGRGYKAMPDDLSSRDDLAEITSEPLLNHLLALSYARGKVNFSEEVNLNRIYADLLEAVYERPHAGTHHPGVGNMTFKEFTTVLEEIALTAWHGKGRTVSLDDIQKHCKASGLLPLLEQFTKDAKAGIVRMLTAFYFRQQSALAQDEKSFEFTHKSFGEYLIARRIVRAIKRMNEELEERKKSYDRGWDEREALAYWVRMCGPSVVDNDLFRFLNGEIGLQSKKEAAAWQEMFCKLLAHVLLNGMPIEKLDPRPDYNEERRQAGNTELATQAAMAACAYRTEQKSKVEWPKPDGAARWIASLLGPRFDYQRRISTVLWWLGHLDLKKANLIWADLRSAYLRGADLLEADLDRADLSEADLDRADLSGADLSGADLSGADLSGADLSGAYLIWADLSGANLFGANLFGANLSRADLRRANLSEANLCEADLRRADLSGADLSRAHYLENDLQGANLDGAIFD